MIDIHSIHDLLFSRLDTGGGRGKVYTFTEQYEVSLENDTDLVYAAENGTKAGDQAGDPEEEEEEEEASEEEKLEELPRKASSYDKAMKEVETLFEYAYRDFARRNRRYRLQVKLG